MKFFRTSYFLVTCKPSCVETVAISSNLTSLILFISNLLPTSDENFAHTARQAYIGLGFALAQAAELKIDSTPMEGFDNDELDDLLDLKEKGMKSVLLLPLGYRDSEDWLAPMKKVRNPMKDFATKVYE